jgi:rapamycin-insensitive companion of mTOR
MDRERLEVLILARSWLAFPTKLLPLTSGLISENTDEKLRFLALETLAELALLDIHLLLKAEGLRPVLQAFIDGPYDMSPHIAMAFLPIMDMPETRQVLRPGLDVEVRRVDICHLSDAKLALIQVAIGAFINMGSKASSSTHDEKLRTCASIVGAYLKTWTGLLYLSMNDKQAIKAFLGALASPSAAVRVSQSAEGSRTVSGLKLCEQENVIDTLFDVFRIDYQEHTHKRNTRKHRHSSVSLNMWPDPCV